MPKQNRFIITSLHVTHPDYDHILPKQLLGSRPLQVQILSVPHHGQWIDWEIDLNETAPSPPRLAEFLLLLIPLRQREDILGDLEEEFNTRVVPQYGIFWARLYYCWQVAMEVSIAIVNAMKACVGKG